VEDSLCVRRIRDDELASLLELHTHLNPVDDPLPGKEQLEQTWKEIQSDPRLRCFVAVQGGRIVGSCMLIIIPNLTRGARPYGLIENVVTHREYRRRGVGTRLMQHALQVAWDQKCYKVMLLTSSPQEGVLDFYEKVGFVQGVKTGLVAYPKGAV
jgi:GNAT superfamily N-acetyltransferase